MEKKNERQNEKVMNKSISVRVIILVALGFEVLSLIGGGIGGVFSTGGLIIGFIGLVNIIVDQTKKTGTNKTRVVNWILFFVWIVAHALIGKYIF